MPQQAIRNSLETHFKNRKSSARNRSCKGWEDYGGAKALALQVGGLDGHLQDVCNGSVIPACLWGDGAWRPESLVLWAT